MNTNGQKSRHFPLLREIYYACASTAKANLHLDKLTAYISGHKECSVILNYKIFNIDE